MFNEQGILSIGGVAQNAYNEAVTAVKEAENRLAEATEEGEEAVAAAEQDLAEKTALAETAKQAMDVHFLGL